MGLWAAVCICGCELCGTELWSFEKEKLQWPFTGFILVLLSRSKCAVQLLGNSRPTPGLKHPPTRPPHPPPHQQQSMFQFIVRSCITQSLCFLCFRCGEDYIGEYCQDKNPCKNLCMNHGTCRIHDPDTSPRAECICPVSYTHLTLPTKLSV